MIDKTKRTLSLRSALLKASWQVSTANLARQLAMLVSLALFTTASLVALKGTFRGLDILYASIRLPPFRTSIYEDVYRPASFN